MYCPSCGAEQSAGVTYCVECGTELSEIGDVVAAKASEDATETEADASSTEGGSQVDHDSTPATADSTPAPDDAAEQQPAETAQHAGTGTQHAGEATAGSSGWAKSRLLAIGAAGLAVVSVFLPWVTAAGASAKGMATEIGPIVLVAGVVALLPPLLSWGRGFGWLSMLVHGIAGIAVAGLSVVIMSYLSKTVTFGTIAVRGQDVPVAAANAGSGLLVGIVAGGLIVLAALGGIVGTLTGS